MRNPPTAPELISLVLNSLDDKRKLEVEQHLNRNDELAAKVELMRLFDGEPSAPGALGNAAPILRIPSPLLEDPEFDTSDLGIAQELIVEGPDNTDVFVNKSKTKPLIGVNADYRAAQEDSPAFSYVAAGYYDSILQVGGVPVMIPPYQTEEDIDAVLERLDGVLLIGGADLDPRRDGWMLHPTVRCQDPRREAFDRCLARKIGERRMPVFGIGAGMQLLNVSQGGNLFLHIPEDLPTALPHIDPLDPAYRHTLELTPGSLMDRVYGDGELRVNSMHHMAVDEVAPGFQVTARCPDGVVEAIESTMEDWFAMGIQFHPETETASALDVRIFEEFVTFARRRSMAQKESLPAILSHDNRVG